MSEAWIGVDLDGTLAQHTPGMGIAHVGEPITPMVNRVKRWLREGKKVRILTARASDAAHTPEERIEQVEMIVEWCVKHIGEELPVTCSKDLHMTELYDDRAVTVQRNTGKLLVHSTRGTSYVTPCYAAQVADPEVCQSEDKMEFWIKERMAAGERKGAIKFRLSWADAGTARVHLIEGWDEEIPEDELPPPGFLLTGLSTD